MIKIAVCDDDLKFVGAIQEYLEQLAKEEHFELEIECFLSGNELLQEYEKGILFDLIYLDIEMHGADGIETAKQIRRKDYHVLIVYISSHEEYLRQLFEAEPFRFLPKPVEYSAFRMVFRQAAERILEQQSNYFHFKTGKSMIKVPCKEILYFESAGRKVIVHMVQRSYEYYGKLNEIEEHLKDMRFVRIHKAYLVNIDNVEAFQYERVAMSDGTILSISQKNRPRIRSEFWKYYHSSSEMEMSGKNTGAIENE